MSDMKYRSCQKLVDEILTGGVVWGPENLLDFWCHFDIDVVGILDVFISLFDHFVNPVFEWWANDCKGNIANPPPRKIVELLFNWHVGPEFCVRFTECEYCLNSEGLVIRDSDVLDLVWFDILNQKKGYNKHELEIRESCKEIY
jgi:hypothetical protein